MRETLCPTASATKPSSSKKVLTDREEAFDLVGEGFPSNKEESPNTDEVHSLSSVNTIIQWTV